MLVNLTLNLEEIERRKLVAIEHKFEYVPQSDPQWLEETGIYQSNFPFNFSEEEFIENLDGWRYNDKLYSKETGFVKNHAKLYITEFGVADNIEQIKKFYSKQIKSKKEKFVIACTPVFQEKENADKGGGWRWHKWGKYIGDLNPQCEYLDDENFGDDFKYVICFHLYQVVE